MYKKSLIGDVLVFVLFLIIFSVTSSDYFSFPLFPLSLVLLTTALFIRNIITPYFPKWSNVSGKKRKEYSTLTFLVVVFGNIFYHADVSGPAFLVLLFLMYELNKYVIYKIKDRTYTYPVENQK